MRRGFTLIEMLVVMALFLTMMLVVSDIFLSVSLAQRKTLLRQQGVNDLQFNLEQMAQAIRLNKIDYSFYDLPISAPSDKLALLDEKKQLLVFTTRKDDCPSGVEQCLIKRVGAVETVFSPNNVNIEALKFFISPGNDPYAYDAAQKKYLSDETPLITIMLTGKTVGASDSDANVIKLQTTVTPRYYER